MVNERVYLKFLTLHTNDGGPFDEHRYVSCHSTYDTAN
jgi:hypothetical protein